MEGSRMEPVILELPDPENAFEFKNGSDAVGCILERYCPKTHPFPELKLISYHPFLLLIM